MVEYPIRSCGAEGSRYFPGMSHDPSGADVDGDPGWIGLLGAAAMLIAAVLVAVALWHFAGSGAPALTPAELGETESLLNQLGFPPGPVDGVIDAQSQSAIRDFQVTAGLRIDGKPSIALLDELRAASAELGGSER
ncbi:MAG TPA: peptidoglycan-binding domain-containing protein [Dongiaceae bacterium]|nr:peptidoglycan-binding domain-containing protein [Dongiaceae bacterium]